MKTLMTILGFFVKIFLIVFYCVSKGAELILTAFNTVFKKLLDK
ncbi:MAG: hypothetical protein ABJD69_06750 [Dokdonia sp.]